MHTPNDPNTNYEAINRASWNDRTEVHFDSEFYDNTTFLEGRNSLNPIELPLLGDLEGQSVLHLQCHFGQDTISMARMGANAVGVDLSDLSIERARELNDKAGANARFIRCNVYDLPQHLDETFDVVFASYGTIGWLPDIQQWADLVARYLKPGGRLVFAEFHPVVWMFDDDFKSVAYRYFNSGPIKEENSGTYTDEQAPIQAKYVSWNHGLSEVVTALRTAGLQLTTFQEFDYSPYDCFSGTEEFEPGKFRIKSIGNKLPMVYALVANK